MNVSIVKVSGRVEFWPEPELGVAEDVADGVATSLTSEGVRVAAGTVEVGVAEVVGAEVADALKVAEVVGAEVTDALKVAEVADIAETAGAAEDDAAGALLLEPPPILKSMQDS